MHSLAGGCHCGNIRVELRLPRESGAYAPRACDCDFCRKHGAAYVSDPRALLTVRVRDEHGAGTYRQGSGQAEMLLCRQCGVLVGALHRGPERLYGVVNARIFDDGTKLGAEQAVSPQTLSAADKVKRWQELWCANVSIISAKAAAAAGGAGAPPHEAGASQHE